MHDFLYKADANKMPMAEAMEISRVINNCSGMPQPITTPKEVQEMTRIKTAENGGYMIYSLQWGSLTFLVRPDTFELAVVKW